MSASSASAHMAPMESQEDATTAKPSVAEANASMSTLDQIRERRSAVGDATWAVMDVNDPGEGVNFINVYAEADGLEMVCRLPDPAEHSTRDGLQADAAFIANAPADVEKLLSAVDAVLELADKARSPLPSRGVAGNRQHGRSSAG